MKNLIRLGALSSLSILTLLSTTFGVGCSETETTLGDKDSGTPQSPDGGNSETCATDGTGTIAVVVSGLPEGVSAKGTLTGSSGAPLDITASTTLADQKTGTYSATAERVTKPDPIVRTLYEPTVSTASFCLAGKQTQTVTISYAEVASSNKLWSTNSNNDSGQVLGFAGVDLAASGTPAAKVALKGALAGAPGKAIAFDKDGNMWSFGATVGDAGLLRFPAASLGVSGEKTPDRSLNPVLSGCSPAFTGLAFDPSGALWATVNCSDQVLRIAPDKLGASGDFTPAAEDFATGTVAPRHVAFDKDGNMWVSDKASVHMFPAASLAAGQAHTTAFKISAKAENDAELPPDALAFDKDGNLWVSNFGGNTLYRLTPSDLAVSGTEKTLVPSRMVVVPVDDLLESLAFDESGGLWIAGTLGKLGRLSPDQLAVNSSSGDPTTPATIVTSADVGYGGGLAFFPAPASLPLYSRVQ